MNKITLFKKYADGEVKPLEINDTEANVHHMLAHGFFLSEAEAEQGKVIEKPVRKRTTKAKR